MQRTSIRRRSTRRVLGLVFLVAAALFAARWIASREPAANSIDGPAIERPNTTHVTEPELATFTPTDHRVVPSIAEHVVTEVDVQGPTVASASLAAGLRLWGTIHFDGLSLEPLEVGCRNGLDVEREMRIDERAQYSFEGLAPGSYWIRAGNETTGIARARVDLRADTRVDLELERPRVVAVRVLDVQGAEWVPPRASVVVTESEPTAETDLESPMLARVFGLRSGAAGFAPLRLTSRTLQYASVVREGAVVSTQPVGPTDTEVVFRIARDEAAEKPGSVTFRLVHAVKREPLGDSTVTIFGNGMMPVSCPGGSGRAQLSPGAWILRFHSLELGSLERDFRIEPGVDLDLGDLFVGAGCAVRGRVVDDRGRGHGAFVECTPSDEHGVVLRRGSARFMVGVSSDGTFELRGLLPGHYRLAASGERRSSRAKVGNYQIGLDSDFDFEPAICARVLELGALDVDGIVLVMRPGIALVVRPSGRETKDSSFRVLSPDGVVVESRAISRDGPERVLLAPGPYDVEMWHERDGSRQRVAVHVARDPVAIDMP